METSDFYIQTANRESSSTRKRREKVELRRRSLVQDKGRLSVFLRQFSEEYFHLLLLVKTDSTRQNEEQHSYCPFCRGYLGPSCRQ